LFVFWWSFPICILLYTIADNFRIHWSIYKDISNYVTLLGHYVPLLGHYVPLFHNDILQSFMKNTEYRKKYNVRCILAPRTIRSISLLLSFTCRLWKMFSVEDRYYKINRILLKIVGIWPYQNSKWMHIQALIITSIFLSAVFVQVYTIYSFSILEKIYIRLTFKESIIQSVERNLTRIIILVGSVHHTWMHLETNSQCTFLHFSYYLYVIHVWSLLLQHRCCKLITSFVILFHMYH